MKTIDFSDLMDKVNGNQTSFVLLNAMEPSPIRRYQIPNSLNIRNEDDIEQRLLKDDEIVVYCSDSSCNQSIRLYYLLEHLGFKNISRYAGGLKDWVSNGQTLEGIMTSGVA